MTKEILTQESISTEKDEGQKEEAPRRRSSSRIQDKLENRSCMDDSKENKKVESLSDLRSTLKTRRKSGSNKKVSRLDQLVDKVDANRYINDKSKAKNKSKPLNMNANQQIETPAESKSDDVGEQLNTKESNGPELNEVKNPENVDLKSNESNPVTVVKETDKNLELKIQRSIQMRRSSPRKSVKDRLGIKVQSNLDIKTTSNNSFKSLSDGKETGLESSIETSALRSLDHLRDEESIKVAANGIGSIDDDKEEGEVDDSDEEEIPSTSSTTPVDLPQQELVDTNNISNAKTEVRKQTNPKLSPTQEIPKLGPVSNKNHPTHLQTFNLQLDPTACQSSQFQLQKLCDEPTTSVNIAKRNRPLSLKESFNDAVTDIMLYDSTCERRRHLTAPHTRSSKVYFARKSKPIIETSGSEEAVGIEKRRHISAPAIVTNKRLYNTFITDATIDKSRGEAKTQESKKTVDSVKKEVETEIEEVVNPLDYVKDIYEPNVDKDCQTPRLQKKSKKECEQKKEGKDDIAESRLEDCSKNDGSEYDPDLDFDYNPDVDGEEEGEDSKDSNYYPSEAAKKRETRSTRFKGN